MTSHKLLKKISLVTLLSLLSFPAYSGKGDFGGIWSDTLNFTSSTLKVKTGPKGNLKTIDGKNFVDVDKIHKDLKASVDNVMKVTGPDHNIVVAGLTVIIRHPDGALEGYYETLQEEKQPLAFISGTVEKGYLSQNYKIIGPSKKHQPPLLLENFAYRIKNEDSPVIKINKDVLSKYCESWTQAQNNQLEDSKKILAKEVVSTEHKSLYSLANSIKNLLDEEERKANAGFGSAVDSEQYLLSYLRAIGNTIQETPNAVFRFRNLFPNYRFEKLTAISKDFSDKLSKQRLDLEKKEENIRSTASMRDTIKPFTDALDKYDEKKEEILGYIFHLHSTNEICCCCASSIADEFFHKTLSKELKRESENPPSIFVMASASKKFDPQNKIRQGIGDSNKLDANEYETQENSKLAIVKPNIFLQTLIEEETKQKEKKK
jgi:hypothetical protein